MHIKVSQQVGWIIRLIIILFVAAVPLYAVDLDGDGVEDVMDVCNNTPAGTAVDAQGRPLGDMDLDCDNDLEDYALFLMGITGPNLPQCFDGDLRECGSDIGACELGLESCIGDLWSGECVGEVTPGNEICDGIDNDCDGTLDNVICTPTANAKSAGCNFGNCEIESCFSGWYDANHIYSDGCECREDQIDQAGLGQICAAAANLGTLLDDGFSNIQFTGNLLPEEDVDWYYVVLSDANDALNARFEFISNPGLQYRMYVVRTSCSPDGVVCGEYWTESPAGRDDTDQYFIKVFRQPSIDVTCASYTLQIRSVPPTGFPSIHCGG